jgi:hypothetical protein
MGHKVVLMARSPFFKDLLEGQRGFLWKKEKGMTEDGQGGHGARRGIAQVIVEVEVPDSFATFLSVMRYVYTGRLIATEEEWGRTFGDHERKVAAEEVELYGEVYEGDEDEGGTTGKDARGDGGGDGTGETKSASGGNGGSGGNNNKAGSSYSDPAAASEQAIQAVVAAAKAANRYRLWGLKALCEARLERWVLSLSKASLAAAPSWSSSPSHSFSSSSPSSSTSLSSIRSTNMSLLRVADQLSMPRLRSAAMHSIAVDLPAAVYEDEDDAREEEANRRTHGASGASGANGASGASGVHGAKKKTGRASRGEKSITTLTSPLHALVEASPHLLGDIVDSMRIQRQQHLWRQEKMVAEADHEASRAAKGIGRKDEIEIERQKLYDEESFYQNQPIPYMVIIGVIFCSVLYSNINVVSEANPWIIPGTALLSMEVRPCLVWRYGLA